VAVPPLSFSWPGLSPLIVDPNAYALIAQPYCAGRAPANNTSYVAIA
jgi:hypothetical protein